MADTKNTCDTAKPMDGPDVLRGTGRTTRTLEEVRKLVEAGHSVVFAVHSGRMADRAHQIMYDRWDWDTVTRHELRLGDVRVRFIASGSFEKLRHYLGGTQDKLLFDHAFWDHLVANSGPVELVDRWIHSA